MITLNMCFTLKALSFTSCALRHIFFDTHCICDSILHNPKNEAEEPPTTKLIKEPLKKRRGVVKPKDPT